MRVGRWLIAIFLVCDALDTVAWLGGLIPDVRGLDSIALALVIARALSASIEGMGVWLVLRREPPARVFAVGALASAAILTTLIVGLGLAPTDIPPGTRSVVVFVYGAAALAGIALVIRRPLLFVER